MLEKTTFSSEFLPAGLTSRKRFELWRDIHNAEIASLDYGMAEDIPFQARIEAMSLGFISLGEMSGTFNRAERSASNIAEDNGNGYCLCINVGQGSMGGVQRGREFNIAAGAGVLMSNSEPLTMYSGERTVWMSVILPSGTLADTFHGVDDRLALELDAGGEALLMLRRYRHFLDQGAGLMAPSLIAHAAESVIDLVGLSLGLKGEAAEIGARRGLRAARLTAIIEKIRTRYADPTITANIVAEELGLSTRYVHDLLQETGLGFSERVLELRLQKTRQMLADRRNTMLISEIALSCGFNDVSYFNRSFRRRFGCTPTAAR